MTRRLASRRTSHLALLVVVGLLAGLVAAPGAAAAAGGMTVSEAELAMVDALNVDRTTRGLVPVRIDSRLMAIAHARSVDMATKHYRSHTQPDGRMVFDILTAEKIMWYGAGEIIAWNNYPTMETSLPVANAGWMGSKGHRDIIVSPSYNYVGVGLAFDSSNGDWIWTGVYIKGPDRTGAIASVRKPTVASGTTRVTKRVTVTWTGADVQLQTLTSGLGSFKVQRRVDGGAWTTVSASTTRTSLTLELPAGHTHVFRVAARDNAGNLGAWSTARTTLPPSIGAVIVTR